MTEDEAKKKWCPFARQEGRFAYGLPTHNRDHKGRAVGSCIGSACMAWRLGEIEYGPVVERRPASSDTKKPDGEGWRYEARGQNPQGGPDWERRTVIRPGYCGLAGQPS